MLPMGMVDDNKKNLLGGRCAAVSPRSDGGRTDATGTGESQTHFAIVLLYSDESTFGSALRGACFPSRNEVAFLNQTVSVSRGTK